MGALAPRRCQLLVHGHALSALQDLRPSSCHVRWRPKRGISSPGAFSSLTSPLPRASASRSTAEARRAVWVLTEYSGMKFACFLAIHEIVTSSMLSSSSSVVGLPFFHRDGITIESGSLSLLMLCRTSDVDPRRPRLSADPRVARSSVRSLSLPASVTTLRSRGGALRRRSRTFSRPAAHLAIAEAGTELSERARRRRRYLHALVGSPPFFIVRALAFFGGNLGRPWSWALASARDAAAPIHFDAA